MDLLILAAGQGSRFGGPKQFEPIDNNQNFIMDYSIFDAIQSGFDKVVIVTRKCFENLVHETIVKRIEGKVKVEVVYQENDYIENHYGIKREKPLGTAYAILMAKDVVKDNFCMINADDFYGRQSFEIAYEYLKHADKNKMNFAMVGYYLKNTLSEKGAVKRGICKANDGYITQIIESKVQNNQKGILIQELESEKEYYAPSDAIASMNMFCFTPKLFEYINNQFGAFCLDIENLKHKEFLIPTLLDDATKQKLATIKMLSSPEKWIGMTYREDKEDVVCKIGKLVSNGLYPHNLWK